MDDKDRKIERVRRAIKNPGNHPDYHSKQMYKAHDRVACFVLRGDGVD